MKCSYSLTALTLLALVFAGHRGHAAIQQVNFPFAAQVAPQTLVIRTHERALYLVLDGQTALRYPIAVPKAGKEWSGEAHVVRKVEYPDWSPPEEVLRDHPNIPSVIRGGDPANPMGVAAILLDRSEIAIHGTTATMRKSIGSAASYGCIRMLNEDVADLYQRVAVGATVLMIP